MILEMRKRHFTSILLQHDKRQLLENLIYLTLKEAELSSKEASAKAISEESSELGDTTMTLLETEYRNGMQQGMQQGIQRGVQQGMHQGIYQVAKNMLHDGEPDDKVCRFTGLSQHSIMNIKKDIQE